MGFPSFPVGIAIKCTKYLLLIASSRFDDALKYFDFTDFISKPNHVFNSGIGKIPLFIFTLFLSTSNVKHQFLFLKNRPL